MVREVPMLVSDSPCSSVLLSDWVLPPSAGWGAGGGAAFVAAGAGMSMLGDTLNRPTVMGAGWTSDSAFGFGVLLLISGIAGCI